MTEKDKTLSYAEKREGRPSSGPRAPGSNVSPIEETRRGVGIDPVRPPQRVTAPKRLDRKVSVALAVNDPLVRATLARVLVRAECVITMVEDARSLDGVDSEIVVADFDHSETPSIVAALRLQTPELGVLAWTSRKAEVERGLAALKFPRFEVIDRGANAADLVAAVQRLAHK